MSGAYSTKKKAEDEKLKRQHSEKHQEILLKDKIKTKNIHDEAEARRNRKKLLEEEKKLEEEKQRQAILDERRRLQQEYIEDFKKNLREQRKKNVLQPQSPDPTPDIPLVEGVQVESAAPTPRIVQARAVEKLLSDELKELHRKLMFTVPLDEGANIQGSDEVVEKREENSEIEYREVEKNGAEEEELIKSRHIRWRDFETSQPISNEFLLTNATSSSSIGSATHDDVDMASFTSDDITSITSDDVAAFEGVTDFGSTQKLRIRNNSSSPKPPLAHSRVSPSPSLASPVPSSVSPKPPLSSSRTSPSPSSVPTLTKPSEKEIDYKKEIKSQSPTPSAKIHSPAPSSPLATRNHLSASSPVPSRTSPSPTPPSQSPIPAPAQPLSSSTVPPEKPKQFQSKIPRLKAPLQSSPPSTFSPSPPIPSPSPPTEPVSPPVPIRAQSPELVLKNNSKSKSTDVNNNARDSTQLFEYMEELARRSGVSMEEILHLANEKTGDAPLPTRKTIQTGLSMEEDRLLHALRELEKTGAKQQNAIGKLYKEINEMVQHKSPPTNPTTESPPRTRTKPKQKTHAQQPPTQPLAPPTQPPQPPQQLTQPTQEYASFPPAPLVAFMQQPAYAVQPIPYPQTQILPAYAQVPPYVQAQAMPLYAPAPPYGQLSLPYAQPYMQPPVYVQPPVPTQAPQTVQQLSPNTARRATTQLSPGSTRKAQGPAQAPTPQIDTKLPSSPTTPKSTPRAHLKQSPKQSPRATAHKLQPAKLQSSFDPTPPPPLVSSASSFAAAQPLFLTPQPPSYPSPLQSSSPPSLQSGLASSSSSIENGNSQPRPGSYAKKTRPLYAKPVEVLASPLPTPIGSPAATPRKPVEPSSFQKWKNTFGTESQPNTSRSHYSDSGSERLGPSDRLGPGLLKMERVQSVEPLEKLTDVNLEDLEGEGERGGEEQKWDAGEEYYDDEFESYSSEDEFAQKDQLKALEITDKKNNLAKSDGRIVKTDQARLLFG